jgi:hypothetical protein
VLFVLGPRVALAESPVHTHLQYLLKVVHVDWDDASGANTDRDVVEEGLAESFFVRKNVLLREVGANQPNATVDVETDSARRDHCFWIGDVEGSDVTNCETIAGMNVRQAD